MYECSNCKTRYSSDEYAKLPAVSRVTDDPTDEYGIENVCPECDNRFHSDKWSLKDEVTVETEEGELDVVVSTVHLIIPHGMEQNLLYESLISHEYGNRIIERYVSQAEAEDGHEEICTQLANDEFALEETAMAKELRFS